MFPAKCSCQHNKNNFCTAGFSPKQHALPLAGYMAFNSKTVSRQKSLSGQHCKIYDVKPRPDHRNMPTQHISQHFWAQHVELCAFGYPLWLPACNTTSYCGDQTISTSFALNNVAICCVGMLRSFGRGFMLCLISVHVMIIGLSGNQLYF